MRKVFRGLLIGLGLLGAIFFLLFADLSYAFGGFHWDFRLVSAMALAFSGVLILPLVFEGKFRFKPRTLRYSFVILGAYVGAFTLIFEGVQASLNAVGVTSFWSTTGNCGPMWRLRAR